LRIAYCVLRIAYCVLRIMPVSEASSSQEQYELRNT
jgi:hypothetical protein